MAVNTPVVVKGRLSVRDEKPPQIMCDTIYPLNTENLPPVAAKPQEPKNAALFLRVPSLDSVEFRHIRLVMTMFEGESPVKIRLADTGKLMAGKCLCHPALLAECLPMAGRCQCGGAGTARLTNGRIFRMINEEGSVIA